MGSEFASGDLIDCVDQCPLLIATVLNDVCFGGRDPPRLIFREQLCRCRPGLWVTVLRKELPSPAHAPLDAIVTSAGDDPLALVVCSARTSC